MNLTNQHCALTLTFVYSFIDRFYNPTFRIETYHTKNVTVSVITTANTK